MPIHDDVTQLIGNTPLELPRPTDDASTALNVTLDGYEPARVAISAHSPESIEVRLQEESRSRRGHSRPDGTRVASDTPPSVPPPAANTPQPPPTMAQPRVTDVVDPWAH